MKNQVNRIIKDMINRYMTLLSDKIPSKVICTEANVRHIIQRMDERGVTIPELKNTLDKLVGYNFNRDEFGSIVSADRQTGHFQVTVVDDNLSLLFGRLDDDSWKFGSLIKTGKCGQWNNPKKDRSSWTYVQDITNQKQCVVT